MMEYRHLIAEPVTREMWENSSAKEFGRLMKGLKGGIQGIETMQFIQKNEVPYDKKVTCAQFVCDYRPQKEEKEVTLWNIYTSLQTHQQERRKRTCQPTNLVN